MAIIPIRVLSVNSGRGCCTLLCKLATDSNVNITVQAYRGGSSADSYYDQQDNLNRYVVLYGGTPPAYETISSWPNHAGDVHQLEYDDSPIIPNCYKVLHYWNCDSSVSNPMIHFDSDSKAYALRSCPALVDTPIGDAMSFQKTADSGAASLTRLAECAEDIRSNLLPNLIEEARTTREIVQYLSKRTNGKPLPGIDVPDTFAPNQT